MHVVTPPCEMQNARLSQIMQKVLQNFDKNFVNS